jgi:uncharacterized protein (DUF1499 family)
MINRFLTSLFAGTLSVVLTSVILTSVVLTIGWANAAQAQSLTLELSPIATLPGLGSIFKGETPTNLGIHNFQLTPCPTSPNCVVSQNGDATHAIEPIVYSGDRKTAQQILIKVLGIVPRTEIITQSNDYIRAQSTSRLLGFVDDLEFFFPEDAKVIHVRSASRLGESDLGVNRRRLEQIRLASQDLGI